MGQGCHLVTWLYKALRELTFTPVDTLRVKWEEDFERPLHNKEWEKAIEYHKKVSRNAGLKNIQFNVLHRAYQTPARLQRYYPESEISCPRCHSPAAHFHHMFWSCPALGQFWSEVLEHTHATTGLQGLQTWEAVSLGIFRKPKQLKVSVRFASLALLLAKRSIAMKWRDPKGPPCRSGGGGRHTQSGGGKGPPQTPHLDGMDPDPASIH